MVDQQQLSDLQLAIMRVLWDRKEATAADVHAELQTDRELAPTTVATLLSRLEKRGLVEHHARGRQYIYHPKVTEQEVRRTMLRRLTDFFFGGDQAALVSHLVRTDDIQPEDLHAIRDLLRLRESDREGDG
jgi:BlaI family transcriptional regulator, penicillinase repressor